MDPWGALKHRLEIESQVSDVAYCDSLMNAVEFVIKYTAACLIALLPHDDSGRRERYRWEYALLRSSGIGSWVAAVQNLAGGTQYSALSNQLAAIGLPTAVEQLTARVSEDDWQYEAVRELAGAQGIAGADARATTSRSSLLEAYRRFVELRNKLDAHGAPPSGVKSSITRHLAKVVDLCDQELALLRLPLVACRRSVTGGPSTVIALNIDLNQKVREQLGNNHRTNGLPDGLFIHARQLERVALIIPAPDATDFHVANGDVQIADKTAEALSYSSGQRIRIAIDDWIVPPDRVADSETASLDVLVPRGRAYTNAPAFPAGYIERPGLQSELAVALQDPRRFVITLQGRGGIGKTSLALHAVEQACAEGWFDIILWFSARDIDLRDAGAIAVQPDIVTIEDLAKTAARTLADVGTTTEGNPQPSEWLAAILGDPQSGRVLWVLDNFETLNNPLEVFAHFDTYVRQPHKVLITTRHREFRGDFPITVSGMNHDEFRSLVQQESVRLGLSLAESVIEELFSDSRGHPYVTKIMLGEMKIDPRSKPKRILERREDILDALFERTFARLSHDARHIFLLLATWRSLVPMLALDVVVNGRDQGRIVDTDEAVAELEALSLIQVVVVDDEAWLDVPLPAWLFGRRKLITDPERIDVERESELLQLFGPSMATDLTHGLVRPTKRFWEAIRDRVGDRGWLEKWEPWLERLGRQVPELWIWIANELEDRGRRSEAERFLRRAVEDSPSDPNLWLRLAQHYESRDDDRAALQAWVARALVPAARFDDVSFAANKVNGWLRRSRVELSSDERRLLVQPLISTMEARSDEADAQDFSRLAWLYVNTGDRKRGIDAARRGLDLDPDQSDCQKFVAKFSDSWTRATRR